MKYIFIICFFLSSCNNYYSHNDFFAYKHKKMLKQDKKMKKQMIKSRRKATPIKKRNKVTKSKRKFI